MLQRHVLPTFWITKTLHRLTINKLYTCNYVACIYRNDVLRRQIDVIERITYSMYTNDGLIWHTVCFQFRFVFKWWRDTYTRNKTKNDERLREKWFMFFSPIQVNCCFTKINCEWFCWQTRQIGAVCLPIGINGHNTKVSSEHLKNTIRKDCHDVLTELFSFICIIPTLFLDAHSSKILFRCMFVWLVCKCKCLCWLYPWRWLIKMN